MNMIQLGWKNILHKPWNMALSVVLFALGVGLISILFLLDKQLQENFNRNLAGIDLVIGAKGSPLQMILSSMYHIDAPTGNISLGEARPFLNPKHPLIESAIPLSVGDSYKTYRIVGTEQSILDLYNAKVREGKVWERNFEATIGASVARELNLKIGDKFSSTHGFMDDDAMVHDDVQGFEIVGILEPTGSVIDALILCTTQSFWLIHAHVDEDSHEGHGHDLTGIPKPLLEEADTEEITAILAKFKGRNYQSLNMQRNINENTDLQAATPAIEITRLRSLMDSGQQALRILAIVIIIVSGLSVFISLFSSLKERKYELSLMRVMGGTRGKLFTMIIMEGLLLAIVGFVLGILLSHIGMTFFAGEMKEAYRYTFKGWEFLPEEGYLLIGALAIAFLAAVIPAIQASRTDISETLAS